MGHSIMKVSMYQYFTIFVLNLSLGELSYTSKVVLQKEERGIHLECKEG